MASRCPENYSQGSAYNYNIGNNIMESKGSVVSTF